MMDPARYRRLTEKEALTGLAVGREYHTPTGMGGSYTLKYKGVHEADGRLLYAFRITNKDHERTLYFSLNAVLRQVWVSADGARERKELAMSTKDTKANESSYLTAAGKLRKPVEVCEACACILESAGEMKGVGKDKKCACCGRIMTKGGADQYAKASALEVEPKRKELLELGAKANVPDPAQEKPATLADKVKGKKAKKGKAKEKAPDPKACNDPDNVRTYAEQFLGAFDEAPHVKAGALVEHPEQGRWMQYPKALWKKTPADLREKVLESLDARGIKLLPVESLVRNGSLQKALVETHVAHVVEKAKEMQAEADAKRAKKAAPGAVGACKICGLGGAELHRLTGGKDLHAVPSKKGLYCKACADERVATFLEKAAKKSK